MQKQLALRTDYESEEYQQLIEKFTQENDRYLLLGGDNYEAEIERTLAGLGFERTDFDRPTKEFSGGWRMRIELAKILLRHPDVLLLDEPTNHLDIESIQWLEQFLATGAKAVVLVSHDRAFINNVTNRTIEITCHHIEDYSVKYDEYLNLRKERREQQLRAYANQQKEIADIKEFIERFRYKPTKAVQVQQRIRQLEKIVPVEVDEIDNSAMHLHFPPCLRSGDYPVICDDVRKDYGHHTVFEHVTLTIKRGEKVAFVGKNGEGKSTLVKCIMGQLLDENLTIYDTIDRVATGDMRLKINDLLGAFMFGGELSEKKVKVLSGGERSRLAMIRLLLEPVNLLILDEPTNHLDIPSKEVLKEAINGIYDYLRAHNAETIHEALGQQASAATTAEVKTDAQPSANKISYADRKEQQKRVKRAQKAVDECEKNIAKMENRLKELDELLAQPANASDMKLVTEETKKTLDAENDRWLELSEALEQIKIEN